MHKIALIRDLINKGLSDDEIGLAVAKSYDQDDLGWNNPNNTFIGVRNTFCRASEKMLSVGIGEVNFSLKYLKGMIKSVSSAEFATIDGKIVEIFSQFGFSSGDTTKLILQNLEIDIDVLMREKSSLLAVLEERRDVENRYSQVIDNIKFLYVNDIASSISKSMVLIHERFFGSDGYDTFIRDIPINFAEIMMTPRHEWKNFIEENKSLLKSKDGIISFA